MTYVVDHPLAQARLTALRRKETDAPTFRRTLRELGAILAVEVTRDLRLAREAIATPLTRMDAPVLAGPVPCLVSVLRAGEALLAGFLDVLAEAPVAHVGAYRDAKTLEAVEYYFKAPPDLNRRMAIVVDPMLATGGTAIAAVARVKKAGPLAVRYVSVLAAPEGVQALMAAHPDVKLWTVGLDTGLDDHGYIVPGLGDAGDRAFGTQ
jgi:uracil phosphoribosyltransferase